MDLDNYLNEWRGRPSLLKMSQPAGWWRDGFPLGNGSLGAMPYGRICEERVLVNHELLWYQGIRPDLPDLSGRLAECREMIANGAYAEANELYYDALKCEGKEGQCAVYHPAADICLRTVSETRFKDYERYLDMSAGESMTAWKWAGQTHLRRSFVSRADDCIVIEQQGGQLADQKWAVGVELHDLIDAVKADGTQFTPPIEFTMSAEDGWVIGVGRYTDPNYNGAEYGVVVRVITEPSATVSVDATGRSIELEGAARVLLLAKVFVYTKSEMGTAAMKNDLGVLEADYDALLKRHMAKHRTHFEACRVELVEPTEEPLTNERLLEQAYSGTMPLQLLQRMTEYGRYLLIASSNHSSVPSHLQGIWNGDYAPPWDCFFMINENLEMNYWQALPGGMSEKALGVFNFYESHLAEYRENARKLFGCRGIFIPALTSPETGLSTHGGSWIVNWISGAGWLCQLFYDYYLFTGDTAFLRDRLLPFMREVALFYEDYMSYDAEGKVVIVPSTSPENWPKEFCVTKSPSSIHPRLTVNATMDIAVAREFFGNLLQSARALDLYADSVEQWECILDGLPSYAINEDGAVREWLDPRFSDNYEHRHLSHIYPVFPGYEVTANRQPELFEAFRVAVDKRGTVGLKDQTGWSFAHMANIRARMGDGEKAYECLETLAQTCVGKNLFTYHNDYRGAGITMDVRFGHSTPFQIDANMGLTSAVYEMLIQSRPGVIKLLPAMPAALQQGSVRGMCTRAGVVVDMHWSLAPWSVEVTFCSTRNQVVTVKLPHGDAEAPGAAITKWDAFEVELKANQKTSMNWSMQTRELVS